MGEVTEDRVRVIALEVMEDKLERMYRQSTETTNKLALSITELGNKVEGVAARLQNVFEEFRRHDFGALVADVRTLEKLESARTGGVKSWQVIMMLVLGAAGIVVALLKN